MRFFLVVELARYEKTAVEITMKYSANEENLLDQSRFLGYVPPTPPLD